MRIYVYCKYMYENKRNNWIMSLKKGPNNI